MTDTTPGSEASAAIASSSNEWPCSEANRSSRSTRSSASSVSRSLLPSSRQPAAVPPVFQDLAEKALAVAAAVDVCGVEQGDPRVERRLHDGTSAVEIHPPAEVVAAQPDAGDAHGGVVERLGLHYSPGTGTGADAVWCAKSRARTNAKAEIAPTAPVTAPTSRI